MLALISIDSPEELKLVARALARKVLSEPMLGEAFADIVASLGARYPEFRPSQGSGGRPITFTRLLVNMLQDTFESESTLFGAGHADSRSRAASESISIFAEAVEPELKMDRMFAIFRFFGHLYVRRLLALKVIGSIAHDLIGDRGDGGLPTGDQVLCVCELLAAAGKRVDAVQGGRAMLDAIFQRLALLEQAGRGASPWYAGPVRAQVRELAALRQQNWPVPALVVQVEEGGVFLHHDGYAVQVIKARSLDGQERASIERRLDQETEELSSAIAENMGVLASRIQIVVR